MLKKTNAEIEYLSGFGNEFTSEAKPGALPTGRNNPQKAPFGLYAEQLTGSAFTAPRSENRRSWLYKIQPSVVHSRFEKLVQSDFKTAPDPAPQLTPEQLRWDPLPAPTTPTTFWQGLRTLCTAGNCAAQAGSAVHLYAANRSMTAEYFVNHDGDFLIVPQAGGLRVTTEFGLFDAVPGEILVIQRGMKFAVALQDAHASGYVCESYGAHFELPYRGPIGANGLANERDFLAPTAWYEDRPESFKQVSKFQGAFFAAQTTRSPFDVVGWHGNYVPYKYDLARFNTMNTVSYDHPDPSIFTVLTSPSGRPGTANVDFVIFPPRWMVGEDTFRPPYYHRNIMSEFMGLIHGVYDAKPAGGGFVPGGSSLHNCMTAHGPDASAFIDASRAKLAPHYLANTLAFMFESNLVYQPTNFAISGGLRQDNYLDCWQDLRAEFKS